MPKYLPLMAISVIIIGQTGCSPSSESHVVEPTLLTDRFDKLSSAQFTGWLGVGDCSLDFMHKVLELETVERKQGELEPVMLDLDPGSLPILTIYVGKHQQASENQLIARVRVEPPSLPSEVNLDVRVGMVLEDGKRLYLFVTDPVSGEQYQITPLPLS